LFDALDVSPSYNIAQYPDPSELYVNLDCVEESAKRLLESDNHISMRSGYSLLLYSQAFQGNEKGLWNLLAYLPRWALFVNQTERKEALESIKAILKRVISSLPSQEEERFFDVLSQKLLTDTLTQDQFALTLIEQILLLSMAPAARWALEICKHQGNRLKIENPFKWSLKHIPFLTKKCPLDSLKWIDYFSSVAKDGETMDFELLQEIATAVLEKIKETYFWQHFWSWCNTADQLAQKEIIPSKAVEVCLKEISIQLFRKKKYEEVYEILKIASIAEWKISNEVVSED